MKQRLFILMIAILFLSCEQKTEWDLQHAEEFPVADCIITNEMKHHDLRLYWSSDELNQVPEGFSGAVIQLSDGITSIGFTEDPGNPGRYVSDLPFIATAGKVYRLTLLYGGLSDTAYASMTGVSPLEAADIIASDGYFRLVYKEGQASMTEVFYDWSADARYSEQYGAGRASETFYSLDNIDIGKEFAPARQIILFPHQTEIIRRKYSLSEDHQGFVRSLLLETEWRGGYFDAEQGNVP